MENFLDEKLEKMGKAGDFVGQKFRRILNKTSKGFIVAGFLVFVGIAVFIWGMIDGARRK